MTRINAFAVAVFAFVLLASSTLLAQEYDIRLTRQSKIGEKYRLSASGSHAEKMTLFVGGTPGNEKIDKYSVDLVASITVIEINERGRAIKYSLGVEKCLVTTAGTTKPLLAVGSVVMAAIEGNRTVLKINDIPVDPITAKALTILIPSHVSGLSDDDVFGTPEKKRVGDTWEINTELAAKSLKEGFNLSTNQSDIKGVSTLDGVVKGGDGDYLIVSSWLSIDNFSVPLPEGVKVQNGQAKAIFSGRFPINHARQRLGHSIKMTMWFAGNRAPGPRTPEMAFQAAMARSLTREFEPLE